MELSREQQLLFDKYVKGVNIFITGPGGAGKSELIRLIFKHAYSQFKEIYVTATTGCASIMLNCKAKTLHSWAGIGIGNGTVEDLIHKIRSNKTAKIMWKNTDILVVDEVSMLSLKLFRTLNSIGKAIRRNSKPFGGIQLIFSGDFYQLPPVGNKDEPETQQFCFECDDWYETFHRDDQIELIKIFRQKDEIYSSVLNQIREGKIKRKASDLLSQYVGRTLSPDLIIEPTKLYPTKRKVEQINISRMSNLKTQEKEFNLKYISDCEMSNSEKEMRKQFTDRDIQIEFDYLTSNLLCEKELKLKIGSQVMCIKNFKSEKGDVLICNGSQGIIIDFCSITQYPIVKYNNGIEMRMMPFIWESEKIPGIGVSQIPLILSWALTIHKSQGATLDAAEIDVGSGIFECGQTYVALSRVKSLDGLYLTSFDPKRIFINKKVKEYYDSLRSYHRSYHNSKNSNNKEEYIPLVIAEEIQSAVPINPFIDYQYFEAEVRNDENGENHENSENSENNTTKIIRFI